MLDYSIRRVMIDLETMSSESNAAIISIGAVQFGHGKHPDASVQFYEKIHPASAESNGHVDRGTMEWWDKQDPAARTEAFSGQQTLIETLHNFHTWIKTNFGDPEQVELWSKGADFDLVVLRNAYYAVQESYPFNFRMHRCYRTLENLMPPGLRNLAIQSAGLNALKHTALNDAKYQAIIANTALANMNFEPSAPGAM